MPSTSMFDSTFERDETHDNKSTDVREFLELQFFQCELNGIKISKPVMARYNNITLI
jgi:hypothetical protein